jgi:hypothetical protein
MARGQHAAWLLTAVLIAAPCALAGQDQQTIELKDSLPPSNLPHRSPQEYAARIADLRSLIAACRAKAPACDPEKVGEDVQVDRPDGSFDARFGWLRDTLKDAQKAKDEDRAGTMREASERLDSDLAQAGIQPTPVADPSVTRAKADAILSQTEFRMVDPNNELARRWAMFGLLIDQFLTRLFSGIPQAPWAVPLVEWGILALAAIGLLIWAWRTTQQQRLAVAIPAASSTAQWQKESDDWARLAEREAAAANWREAVHCLYWSAIVLLEGKRLWRANRARTPREYLPLLEAGSPRRNALTGLTRIFERIWYGLRPADRTDFERAQALLHQLKAS